MVKTIIHPVTKQTLKLGRRRPVAHCPRLSLGRYLKATLPTPPLSCHYSYSAESVLANIYGNDQLGDCVIAGIAHLAGEVTGVSGATPFAFTMDQIVALYGAIGGYVPGDPSTDNGCDEQTALNYWMQHGAPAGQNQIAGWLAVNPGNPQEYRAACWLFGNLVFGLELPDAWINPSPSQNGFVWDVAGPADPNNGHCVVSPGSYNENGIIIDTWGMLGFLTDKAIATYGAQSDGGEMYTVITKEILNAATQKAPSGVDWARLVADFDAIGGKLS
jgi:hypothetical protein